MRASPYDAIARLYDPWSRSVVEDVEFYVAEARKAAGRPARGRSSSSASAPGGSRSRSRKAGVPRDRRRHLGRDARGLPRTRAEAAGVDRAPRPPARATCATRRSSERVPLVTCPVPRVPPPETRRRAPRGARRRARPPPARRSARFDVFAPSPDDIEETHGRWIEREPGIWERAIWDEDERRLTLDVRGDERRVDDDARVDLGRRVARRCSSAPASQVEACYGWFDRRPFAGGEDAIWIARRP